MRSLDWLTRSIQDPIADGGTKIDPLFPTQSGFLVGWVLATWAGWILGMACTILLAVTAELLGTDGSQWPVGVGMGAGVGLMQATLLRRLGVKMSVWFWSSCLGLALPFLAIDVASAMNIARGHSLLISIAVGGTVSGVFQAFVLQRHLRWAPSWAAGSLVCWALAGGASMAADLIQRQTELRGVSGAIAFLGVTASGGLVLGMTSAVILRLLLRRTS